MSLKEGSGGPESLTTTSSAWTSSLLPGAGLCLTCVCRIGAVLVGLGGGGWDVGGELGCGASQGETSSEFVPAACFSTPFLFPLRIEEVRPLNIQLPSKRDFTLI